jgi:allantoin racemase
LRKEGGWIMKLVVIAPYSNINQDPSAWEREIISQMEAKGQLKGIEVDTAAGFPTDYTGEGRGADFAAIVSPGAIKRVIEYSEMGKYDAIVVGGGMVPGFFGARTVSKIPVAYTVHSSVHIASLIGERFSVIHITDDECQVIRRFVQNLGLGHKLASVRSLKYSSTHIYKSIKEYKREEVSKVPEQKEIMDALTAQCVAAIEKDLADSLVFECPAFQFCEAEVRENLNKLGYSEIQIICGLPAGIEMARAMANLKLIQAPRAYPSISLKAKPEFR